MKEIARFAIASALAAIVIARGLPAAAGVLEKDDKPPGWKEERGDHFIIYYNSAISEDYVLKVAREAERCYNNITEALGFTRFDFWLWEERAKIFVYKTQEEYKKHRHQPEWSGASVNIRQKKIYTFYLEGKFFDRFLPHEISHIIFREFVGMGNVLPLWLDEGVACAQEEAGRLHYMATAKSFVESKMYLKLPELMMVDKEHLNMPTMFYAQSASVIIFLQEEFTRRKFTEFCRELRDGTAVERALEKVYRIKGADDLNDRWEKFLRNTTYREMRDKYGSPDTGE